MEAAPVLGARGPRRLETKKQRLTMGSLFGLPGEPVATRPRRTGTADATDSGVIVGGLLMGAALGLVGGLLDAGPLQNVVWMMSSLALLVATPLLAFRHARAGRANAAAGFALFAVAEAILWAGGPPDDIGNEAAFAAGVLFHLPALFLIALGEWSPLWTRAAGLASGTVFAIHGFMYLMGEAPPDLLQTVGYVVLVVAIGGWIWAETKKPSASPG